MTRPVRLITIAGAFAAALIGSHASAQTTPPTTPPSTTTLATPPTPTTPTTPTTPATPAPTTPPSGPSAADTSASRPATPPAPSAARVADPAADSGPNRAVIVTGVLSVLVWYVPSVIVAAGSAIPSDSSLFVPVAGPWLDLADRPACGPGSISCRVETGNQFLLVADGLFQAWGVAATVIGFASKEYGRAASALRVTPARIGKRGYGLAALGTF